MAGTGGGRAEGAGGRSGVAAAAAAAASSAQPPEAHKTSFVAPFHGPLPSSPFAFGSSSCDALPVGPLPGGDTRAADGSSSIGAKGSTKKDSFHEITAVEGISAGQHVQPISKHDGAKNLPRTSREESARSGGCGVKSSVVFPISTWEDPTGREAARGGSGADTGGGSEDDTAGKDPVAGKTFIAVDSPVAGGGASRTGRGDGRSGKPPSQPLKHGLGGIAEATKPQAAVAAPTGRAAAGGYNMGVSGTGVALPWRNNNNRRQGPVASSFATTVGGGGGGAGANRRRMRREQTRARAAGEGGPAVARLNWGSDTTTGGGSSSLGASIAANAPREAVLVNPPRWVAGGGRGSASGEGVGDRDNELPRGAAGEERSGAVADLDGMILVTSAVVGEGGGGAVGEEEDQGGRSSGGNKGWRAAGDSLANLKARMKYQQHPALGLAGCKRNAGDRGPHHIPYQAF